jgi:hypothetical protein
VHAHEPRADHDRIAKADHRDDGDAGAERHRRVRRNKRNQADEQDAAIVENHRAQEGARRAAARGEDAGADRGGDEEERNQGRRGGSDEAVELVPVGKHSQHSRLVEHDLFGKPGFHPGSTSGGRLFRIS